MSRLEISRQSSLAIPVLIAQHSLAEFFLVSVYSLSICVASHGFVSLLSPFESTYPLTRNYYLLTIILRNIFQKHTNVIRISRVIL